MGSSRREIELEEQLKEAGNILLSPPSSVVEVINLLDKVEHLLANVEQAPSKSMQDAILPTMKALIANDLLRHSDMDVRLSVTSCINEITRITAPESPYDDDLMKEIFQSTVAGFEYLSHASGRYYLKALSILDTVAKVRSCLLMLDLECDKLVIEMFRHFLKVIRSNHPHAVFSAMETIMTLVIDESEDVSWDLLSILLASVKKENQDVSPISWKLGENVFTNCAAKLKTNLKEAVQSRGIALDEYAEIVSSICGDDNTQHGHLNGSKNQLATKEPDPVCLGEVFHDADVIIKPVTSNETAPSGNEGSVVKDKLSNKLEQSSQVDHSQSVDARCNAGPDTSDSMRIVLNSEMEPERAPKKRGRKPNSLMNPEEGYDHSWISTGRKTGKIRGRRKLHDKEVDCSPSVIQDSKKEAVHSMDKMFNDPTVSPKSGLHDVNPHRRDQSKKEGSTVNEDANLKSSESPSTPVEEKASGSADFSFRKEPEDRSDTEIKRRKRSKANEEISRPLGYGSSKKEAEFPADLKEKEKPWKLAVTKKKGRNFNKRTSVQKDINKGSLVVAISAQSVSEAFGAKKKKTSTAAVKSLNKDGNSSKDAPKTEVKKNHSTGKEEKKKISKALVKSSDGDGYCSEQTPKSEGKKKHSAGKKEKKMISMAAAKSSKRDGNHLEETPDTEFKKKTTAGKVEKKMISKVGATLSDGNHSEETPKTGVKRKQTPGKKSASKTPDLGEQLVGSRIKVWWPMDKTFYKGVVDSYDRIKKKHRILYADGDEEMLNLKRECWELIKSGDLSEVEQEADVLKHDASSDILPKVKEEIELELVQEVKSSSLKRSKPSASASRAKAKKSGGSSADVAKLDKPINADESKADVPEKVSSAKRGDQNSPAKLILKDRKLIFTLCKQQQAVNTPEGESLKAGNGESADDNPVETSKEAAKGSTTKNVDTNVVDEEM